MASIDRRTVLATLTGAGIGNAVFHRSLAAQVAERGEITAQMLADAEWISDVQLTEEQRDATLRSVQRVVGDFEKLRKVPIEYADGPCLHFNPAPWIRSLEKVERNRATLVNRKVADLPKADNDLAFLPVYELAGLIRSKRLSSIRLTKIYLERLKRFDSKLKCVVTLTEDLALAQAKRADQEIAAGDYRGPLHGIPWGAKDLIAYPGFPTTWGAPQFRERVIQETATVAARLEEAGAVLVAKLSLGALAQGDKWFGGMTRNPWNPEQGSSGSSAGSASAVAAGLVGFALGSETLGSIVSPCRRCGTTGLRPTFGRVSRHGCMTLAWSMDKIGPIARSVEDCALIFDAMHGEDGKDATVKNQPFNWPSKVDLNKLRVGFVPGKKDEERDDLQILRRLGVQLIPIELPKDIPVWAVTLMLGTEAGTVFDPLTRASDLEGLNTWPQAFRRAQFVPAVEYLRAARVRQKLIEAMRPIMQKVDLYVEGDDLGITNLTGHPTVVIPNGVKDRKSPETITLTGQLFGESTLLTVARAMEQSTQRFREHPTIE